MRVYKYLKYTLDWNMALILTVVLSPIFLAAAIAIRLEDGGPVLFRQERTGQYMKRIRCFKFRTMKKTDVAFDKTHPVIGPDNENVTKVGKVLRRLKIDELPQLFNVLRGEMCLIAPRPLMIDYENEYEDWELVKFNVKPGLTGLGQVKGNGYLETWERNYYDALYVMKMSPLMDFVIVVRTVGVILFGEERFVRHVTRKERKKLRKTVLEKWADQGSAAGLSVYSERGGRR